MDKSMDEWCAAQQRQLSISRNAELSFKASMETTSDLLLELNLERVATEDDIRDSRATISAAKQEAMLHGHRAVELLADPEVAVREAALVCIRHLDGAKPDSVQQAVLARFQDTDWTVRRLSVEVLEAVGPAGARILLCARSSSTEGSRSRTWWRPRSAPHARRRSPRPPPPAGASAGCSSGTRRSRRGVCAETLHCCCW